MPNSISSEMSLKGRRPRVVAKSRTMIGGLRWMIFMPPSSVMVAVWAEGVTGTIGLPGPEAGAEGFGAMAAGRGRGGENGAEATGGRLGGATGVGEEGGREAGGVGDAIGEREGTEAMEGAGEGELGGRRPGVTRGAFGRGALKGALGPPGVDAGRETDGNASGRETGGGDDTGREGGAEGRLTAWPGAEGGGGGAGAMAGADGGGLVGELDWASAARRAAVSLRSRTTSSADFTIGPTGPLE